MEKTFKEVITDIKDGEVWESKEKIIKLMNTNDIVIALKDRNRKINSMGFPSDTLYHLQRKEYTFEEAFKAYEDGKEIENVETKAKIKKEINGLCCYKFERSKKWLAVDNDTNIFSIDAIRGRWYIND